MFTKVKLILIGLLSILGLIAGAFLRGRSSGKAEVKAEVVKEQTKAVEEVAKQRVENMKVVTDVKKEAISNSDSIIDQELSDKWTRG